MALVKLKGDGIEPNQIIEVERDSPQHKKALVMGFVEISE